MVVILSHGQARELLPIRDCMKVVLEGTMQEPGMHVNAVGSSASAWSELEKLLIGANPGHTSETEITLFGSLGLAVADLAVGRLVFERAMKRGIGTAVDLAK